MPIKLSAKDLDSFGIKVPSDAVVVRKNRASTASAASVPQARLWELVSARWPSAVQEYRGAIAGRRFSIDIVIPVQRIAIEVDGWQFHGKYLESFKRDRIKQNLLVANGWRILRFFPEQIFSDSESILRMIEAVISLCGEN